MKFESENTYTKDIMNAIKSGDEKEISKAFENFHNSLVNAMKSDYAEVIQTNDKTILAQRGYRELTSKETKFYEKFIEGAKSSNPKQALTDLLTTEGGMPETIIEDVYKDLVEEHPLLSRIKFQNVKYLTKWLLNDHTADKAIWGEINAEITKQIESAFKSIDIIQGKLSAFVVIALDMLDLGPKFLDAYIRTILKEAMACGLEYGIVKGIGVKGEPIGLIRDVSEGVSVNSTTGYPSKTPIKVMSFDIEDYCNLIADNLLKKENGTIRKLSLVTMIVNPVDYLKKIIPATTVRTVDGTYKNDLFPFPTDVIQSNVLDEGEAILAILPEYFFGVGVSKNASLEYSDEFKFLEDKRVYKSKMFGFGRAEDDNSAILLDISALKPTYITVNNVTEPIA
mgnify:CR=1 FL=1